MYRLKIDRQEDRHLECRQTKRNNQIDKQKKLKKQVNRKEDRHKRQVDRQVNR